MGCNLFNYNVIKVSRCQVPVIFSNTKPQIYYCTNTDNDYTHNQQQV